LIALVATQTGILGIIGTLLGAAMLMVSMRASAHTPIPIESTPEILAAQALLSIFICLVASVLAMRSVFGVEGSADGSNDSNYSGHEDVWPWRHSRNSLEEVSKLV
jgi:hypothetical protein